MCLLNTIQTLRQMPPIIYGCHTPIIVYIPQTTFAVYGMASGNAAVLLFILFLHCLPNYSTHQRGLSSTKVRTLHEYVPPNSTDYICSDFLEVSGDIVLSAFHKFVEKHFLQCLATNVNPIITYKNRRRKHESRPPERKSNHTPKNP